MASQRIIFIALIIMVAISPSLGSRGKLDVIDNLREISSRTENPTESWKIIKPHLSKFESLDPKAVADVVIDLAKTRGDEIQEQLNRLHEDSKNDELKAKYLSCSQNYNDATRNLNLARRDLESNDFQNISIQIDDAIEELGCCGLTFEGDSFDPAHIRNRVKEFGNYVNIVKVAVDRLLRQN